MANLKIKQTGKDTEIFLDDKPVILSKLIEIDLNMNARDGNNLTLTYRVSDVDIETDNVDVKTIKKLSGISQCEKAIKEGELFVE